MKCLTCHGLITNGNCGCSTGTQGAASVNIDIMLRDRDAEIAALKAELADTRAELGRAMLTGREIEHENTRLRAALAAGPAALRALRSDDYSPGYVAGVVEAAQAAAMKEGT